MMDDSKSVKNTPAFKLKFLALQALTLARIPLAILFAILLNIFPVYRHQPDQTFTWQGVDLGVLILGTLILILIELTDLFDGMSARKLGMVTEWGAMLDPYSDSISRLIVYWAFTIAQPTLALPAVPLAMAIRDVTVAYSRIVMAKAGQSVSAKFSGKAKAVVQGVAAIIILLGPLYWPFCKRTWTVPLLSWIVVCVTLASMLEYVRSAIHAARRQR